MEQKPKPKVASRREREWKETPRTVSGDALGAEDTAPGLRRRRLQTDRPPHRGLDGKPLKVHTSCALSEAGRQMVSTSPQQCETAGDTTGPHLRSLKPLLSHPPATQMAQPVTLRHACMRQYKRAAAAPCTQGPVHSRLTWGSL